MDLTIKAKLLAKKSGLFTMLVFENTQNRDYIMCTVLANWDVGHIPIHTEGFLTYELAQAGDQYYNASTGLYNNYKYSQIYFKNFVPNNKEITL